MLVFTLLEDISLMYQAHISSLINTITTHLTELDLKLASQSLRQKMIHRLMIMRLAHLTTVLQVVTDLELRLLSLRSQSQMRQIRTSLNYCVSTSQRLSNSLLALHIQSLKDLWLVEHTKSLETM